MVAHSSILTWKIPWTAEPGRLPSMGSQRVRSKSVRIDLHMYQFNSFSSVQSLSHVRLFGTLRTAARQASLSFTISWSFRKLMSIESVMPSNHLILCRPLLLPSIFPSIRVFWNESFLCIRWPNIGVSASALVLPMNIQDWLPLAWNSWISLLSKGLLRIFSNTKVQKHQFLGAQLSF